MKRIAMCAAACLLALTTMAEMRQAVILYSGDSQIVYYLDDEPQITLEGQNMVITVDGEAESVPMESIDYWLVGMSDYTALKAIDGQAPAVHVKGGSVTVTNPAGAPIAVYNMSGVLVATSHESIAELQLERGIYVITVGNKSFKIKN